MNGRTPDAAFPGERVDARVQQIEETWQSLMRQLRGPVDTTLRGGMSAGDIAYRLGELVHNYFRTRGVTLTSFELRRIVVALLDNYRNGWPALNAPAADMAAAFAGAAAPARPAAPLVAFTGRQRTPAGNWDDEVPASPAIVTPDLPSSLVRVEPRPSTPASMSAPASTSAPGSAAAAASAPASQPAAGREAPTPVGVDAALAAIMPALRVQRGAAPAFPTPHQEIMRWLRSAIDAALGAAAVSVAETERERLERQAFDELFGLGPLEASMRDETVSAIFVNGLKSVFVDRRGRLERTPAAFRDAAQLDSVVGRLAELAGVTPAVAHDPLIDRRLEDGTRVTVVGAPLAARGPYLVIRRPATRTVTLDTLVAEGALSPQMATVLRLAVRSRLNLLVTGGPGAGKTAFLAGLARAAPADERIVTVERIAELSPDLQHHVSLVAPDDAGIAPAQVLAAALVLRPDHLLVDGLAETVAGAIANAAAAGSNGIAASVAAGTPQSAVERFEGALRDTGAAAAAADARRLATQTFDMVVHLERQRDGVRRVKHIADLAVEGETIACRDLFIFDPIAGRFIFTGVRPNFMPRVAQAGLEAAMLGAL